MSLEGIRIICFGGSYAVALGAELLGRRVPLLPRRTVSLGFTAAGILAHTLYLGHRALGARAPVLSTCFDSLLVLSWILAILYLSVYWRFPKVPLALFALPLILALVGFAAVMQNSGQRELPGLTRVWGPVHGAILMAGAVAVFVGFVAGLMYLVQSYRLKHKHLPGELWQLPSLEFLERLNHGGIAIAFVLLTIGLGIGLMLAVQQRQAGNYTVRLLDPKVISGGALWVTFALLLQARTRPHLRGRRVAILTSIGFAMLLFTIVGVDLLLDTWH